MKQGNPGGNAAETVPHQAPRTVQALQIQRMPAMQHNITLSLPATAGATVLCLHSSAGNGAQWRTLAQTLPPHAHSRVQTPDLPGHGALRTKTR